MEIWSLRSIFLKREWKLPRDLIDLDGAEVVALYVLMRRHDLELDARMISLYERLERILHDRLSIEQMENIENLYENEEHPLA